MFTQQIKFKTNDCEVWFGGILIDDENSKKIICGCCGGVIDPEEEEGIEIEPFENWIDISEAIKGDG